MFAAADQPDVEAFAVGVDAKATTVFIVGVFATRAGFYKPWQAVDLQRDGFGMHAGSFPMSRETARKQTAGERTRI